jgi:PAS domain S-box-containing protein
MSTTASAAQSVAGSAAAPADARSEARVLLADRAAQLYSQLPLGIAGSVMLIVVAVYALRATAAPWAITGWSAAALAVTAARGALWWAYQRSPRRAEDARHWMRWLAIGALANGTIWGVLAGLFFQLQPELENLFLILVLAGVLVGGIATYAASWSLYALYGAPVILPFTYNLVTSEDDLLRALAFLVPLFYAACVGVAYRLNHLFLSGFRSQFAFRRLNTEYSALNQRLAQQLEELAAARRQVDESGRKLALFVERSPVAVFELDARGRALHVNPTAETLFGHAASELGGREVAELLFAAAPRAEIVTRWREMLRTRQPALLLRQPTQRRDGSEIICEWSLTPLVSPEGRVISVIAQGRDMTQQLEAERLKQEFTSTLSHELRTPLTAVIGALQLLNSGALGSLGGEALELTAIAERNSQRLLDLINDLLDLEKIESGRLPMELQPMPLDELVRESLTLNRAFADRFRVRLELSDDLAPAWVRVDRRRMLQVLTNLLSNAAKFSPEGAVVEVTVDDLGRQLRVGVHDRGPGIPLSFHSRIFSRFAQADMSFTRQKGGTGLGLAICRRLMDLMGGQIGFGDRPGGGTTFWIELPKYVAPSDA